MSSDSRDVSFIHSFTSNEEVNPNENPDRIFLLLIKGSIILHLCSSKIARDNYASLQMIPEYFPARGRLLNRVKKNRVLSWNSDLSETSGGHIEFESS